MGKKRTEVIKSTFTSIPGLTNLPVDLFFNDDDLKTHLK